MSLSNILESAIPILNRITSEISKDNLGTDLHREIGRIIEAEEPGSRKVLRDLLELFLLKMFDVEASDIDVGAAGCGGKIWYRIYGKKSPVNIPHEFDIFETDVLLHNILLPEQREFLITRKNLDFSYSLITDKGESIRFRADMYIDLDHFALNMRRIDNDIRPFKNLGLHPEVAKALSLKYFKYGMTLVTGITGSGKSSTLDTIIDANNRTVDAHIVVIASPVELIHKPIRSVVRHREVGSDVSTFKAGAIQALRQDPDIIVIGELRDPETILTALEITDSGHKTFSTLHTSSAMESIERILGEVPTEEQNRVRNRLADVLTCVISQKLVPTLDGKLALAKEVLLCTSSVKAAIRNNNIGEIYQMMMEGSEKGMVTMEQDLKRLFEEGKISREEALNYANNKSKLTQLLTEVEY